MDAQQEQIREQQKQSWNKFSPGWKKWDTLVMNFLKPMGDVIIDKLHIGANDKVLDIAAGTGEPGLTIAAIVKNGSVTGTDLSDEMLKIAEGNAVARGLDNYTTRIADVCELPFTDNSFGKISCRMGFMFFPDMQLAANEMYRVLKPGGLMATSVWGAPDKNLWVTVTMGIISKHVELPPPVPGAPGMFRCAKPGLIAEILANAGFKNINEQEVSGKADYDTAENYWQHMMEVAAPVISAMDKADEATREAIKNEVMATIRSHSKDGKTLLDFGAKVIYAEK